jgi:hypothetical protein
MHPIVYNRIKAYAGLSPLAVQRMFLSDLGREGITLLLVEQRALSARSLRLCVAPER